MSGLRMNIIKYISAIFVLTSSVTNVETHTSIIHPPPISYFTTCRVGNNRNCPGPCPNQLLRKDKTMKTVRRGSTLYVITRKNNHFGGFIRWSIVKVKDMWKKDKHTRGAFFYTCHDVRLSSCNYANKAWCKGDKKNQYYTQKVFIPSVFPDGDYVLSMVWYGGLFSTKDSGNFGDYYDCMYIKIRGGPLVWEYRPTYAMGPSVTGKQGHCKATVNRIGYCWREPCKLNGMTPEGKFFKPWEFSDGRKPKKVKRVDYL